MREAGSTTRFFPVKYTFAKGFPRSPKVKHSPRLYAIIVEGGVKLGYSECIPRRLNELSIAAASRPKILWQMEAESVEAAKELEALMHSYFSAFKIRGEIFEDQVALHLSQFSMDYRNHGKHALNHRPRLVSRRRYEAIKAGYP